MIPRYEMLDFGFLIFDDRLAKYYDNPKSKIENPKFVRWTPQQVVR